VPVIDLPNDELAALTKALRRLIKSDKYPHALRLDPLKAALARRGGKAPSPAKADKRARRSPAPDLRHSSISRLNSASSCHKPQPTAATSPISRMT
jgi:hypothetical protein